MAEQISLSVRFEGNVPETVHLHFDLTADANAILARLESMENTMSALSEAVDALVERINTDITELQRQLAEKDALLQEAMANDADDQAAIDDLTSRNDALNAEIETTIASLGAIDPLTDFPAEPEPTPEPGPDV